MVQRMTSSRVVRGASALSGWQARIVTAVANACVVAACVTASGHAQTPVVATPAKADTAAPKDPHTAQPERPTVATHAGTVAPGWVEVETGLELDFSPGTSSNHITTIVTKFGVASHVQFSVYVNGSTPDGGRTGFGDLSLGLTWRLVDDHP